MFFITYPSALSYWLVDAGLYELDSFINAFKPLHVFTASAASRSHGKDYCCHVQPEGLPKNSFIEISSTATIASPELCFLLAANELSIPELVVLANDLCAIYVRDKYSDYGQHSRDPVTTVASIRSYLDRVQGIHGIKKAKTAIAYAVDNSNSPMESIIAAIGYLPFSRGGFALSKPILNHNVPLNSEGKDLFGQDTCCCDMVWVRDKVGVEYDSNMAHLSVAQHYHDKRKYSALTASGYKVISITAEQIKSTSKIDTVFTIIRNSLKLHREPLRLSQWSDLRLKTIESLFQKDYSRRYRY